MKKYIIAFYLVGMSGGLVSAQETMFQKYGCQTKVMELIKIQYFMRIILILTHVGLEMIII